MRAVNFLQPRRLTPVEAARADIAEALVTIHRAKGVAGALLILDAAKIDFVLRHRAEAERCGWIV
jgi:hypothetical protein